MRLPILLPEKLKYTAIAETDRDLYSMLVKMPPDFVIFFESACEDETWGSEHSELLKMMLNWITQQFYQDKVESEYAVRILKTIQAHHGLLDELISRNLSFIIEGSSRPVNSFLWGANSDKLRTLLRRECRDKYTNTLTLPEIPQELFDQLDQFMLTGTVYDLTTKSKDQILQLMQQALIWELTDLVQQCEKSLKKYINHENIFDLLIMAHKKRLSILRQACFDFVNALEAGVFFKSSDMNSLILGFENFREKALNIFEKFRKNLTHLAFPNDVSSDETMIMVMQKVPDIRGIDLTLSSEWSENFLEIPSQIKEINLSQCGWLTPDNMSALFLRCPHIEGLSLAHDSHLHYSAWSQLKNLRQLDSLDISNCDRLEDEEFRLILNACPNLRRLNLESCTKLDENAFNDLSQHLKHLIELNVANTNVTDPALASVTQHCTELILLNVSNCRFVSANMITQIKKQRPFLQLRT